MHLDVWLPHRLTPAKHAAAGVAAAFCCYVLLYKAGCRAKTVAKTE